MPLVLWRTNHLHACWSCPRYFWEPHWKSMELPVVSGVAWQVCIWNADITKWWVESYQSLGVEGRRLDELVTVVDTVGCLNDNLCCHRWWRGYRTGDVLFSVMVILNMFFLYVYFVSGCNKALIYLIFILSIWSTVIWIIATVGNHESTPVAVK